jgi:hypothetical protein
MGSLSTSQTLSDDLADYDVISEGGSRSLESSIADLNTYDPSEELEFPSDPHTPNSTNGGSHIVPLTAQNTLRCKGRDTGSSPLNFGFHLAATAGNPNLCSPPRTGSKPQGSLRTRYRTMSESPSKSLIPFPPTMDMAKFSWKRWALFGSM